jgi:hypothetical protein
LRATFLTLRVRRAEERQEKDAMQLTQGRRALYAANFALPEEFSACAQ